MRRREPLTIMKTHRATIAAEGRRVAEVFGAGRARRGNRALADHAVRGKLPHLRDDVVTIGRADIDWSASHREHHVWGGRVRRFTYAPALLSAWNETGDREYLDAAWDYIRDWIRAHPSGEPWQAPACDNMLDLAARLQSWLTVLTGCADADEVADDDFTLAVEAIRCQLEYLRRNVSPHGNFRTIQATAMLKAGLTLRFLPESADWRDLAVRVFNDAARRQILPDGAHVETTPSYHRGMTAQFATCVRVGRAWPDLGMRVDPKAVGRMFDYLLAHTRPNGSLSGLNDSEGVCEGTVEDPSPQRRRAFLAEAGLPTDPPTPSAVFPVARQATFRSDWTPDAEYLTFEASRWGSAHAHLARNGVTLHAYGRSLLVDPGRMEYEMSRPEGPYGKSTRAHNTLTVNGWNQYRAENDDFRAWTAPGYGAAVGRYAGGYWPAPFGWWFYEGLGRGLMGVHTRILFWVAGRFAVVVDHFNRWNEQGRGERYESPHLEINWQLAPGADVLVEGDRARTRFDDANLLLCFARLPEAATLGVHEGQREPMRGWVRDGRGQLGDILAAPQVSVEVPRMPEYITRAVTVLVPYRGPTPPDVAVDADPGDAQRPGRLRLAWADGRRDTVLWNEALGFMLGDTEAGETDGSLLYVRHAADDAQEAAAIADGTCCRGAGTCTLLSEANA